MKKELTLLIVDDDPQNIFALTAALKVKGYTILKAEHGKECLDMLANKPDIDLVLMDMMMPVMDGFETIEHIRKGEKLSNIPIIAVTAMAMKGDRELCLRTGADDYLTKPVSIVDLYEKIDILLKVKA